MNKGISRIICTTLAILTAMPSLAIAADLSTSYTDSRLIAKGVTLTDTIAKTPTGGKERAITLDYTPGGTVRPMVVYGANLYGKSDINAAVAYCESLGNTVIGAINADFFQMTTGIPIGMVVNNGRLCVSNGNWTTIGFMADGSVIHGAPLLNFSVKLPTGASLPIYSFNKVRSDKGIFLYSRDYAGDTKTGTQGTHVLLQAVTPNEYIKIGGVLRVKVVSVTTGTAPALIGADQFVLSLDALCKTGVSLAAITQGMELTLNVTTADPAWHNVVYACGGGEYMMRGGQLTTASNGNTSVSGSPLPRTMVGFRPDGSMVMFEFDGGAAAETKGITLKDAALRLQAMGCTDVINMDGGGSSAISIRKAGLPTSTIASVPSDGAPRKCANYIMLVNTADKTVPASRSVVYPKETLLLPGATTTVTGYSYSDDYMPKATITTDFSATSGSFTGNVYTAPSRTGTADLSVKNSSLTPETSTVTIVSEPGTIGFVKSGTTAPMTTLNIKPNEKVDLDIYCTDGLRRIASNDSQFKFGTTGNAGTIDATGMFTAGIMQGLSGTITATYGNKTVVLNVTVGTPPVVLTDFENEVSYITTTLDPTKTIASAEKNTASENARFGTNSLKLSYSAPGEVAESIAYTSATRYIINGASHISFMVKGSGEFYADFLTKAGVRVPVSIPLTGNDWQYIAMTVPTGAEYLLGFSAKPVAAKTGTAYIDLVMRHYGAPVVDTVPPTVEVLPYDLFSVTFKVSDNLPLAITRSMLEVRLDNVVTDTFTYENGIVSITPPVSTGVHKVTLTAHDANQNSARATASYGTNEDNMFADLRGQDAANPHWVQAQAEYLRQMKIFSDDANFYPTRLTTNEMAATLVSRYLKLDTTLYADTVLPYVDAGKIADWALPHVKALYATGIMKGSLNYGVLYFSPQLASSRAQIMTIISRTLSRSLTAAPVVFTDFATVPAWAQSHVSFLGSLKIVTGEGTTGNVNPLKPITRAEFASILYKLY